MYDGDRLRRPEQLRPQQGRRHVDRADRGRDENTRRGEIDHRQMVGENLLNLIVYALALGGIGGGNLPHDQLVDATLPIGGRRLLSEIPDVRPAVAGPEIQVDGRIGVGLRYREIDGLILPRPGKTLDERQAFERDDVHRHANLLQLVADDRNRSFEVRPSLLREQREPRRPAAYVLEHPVAVAIGKPDTG